MPFLLLGGAFVLALVGAGLALLQRGRTLENLPTSRLRSAAQGYVELEGHAALMPGPPIIAPLTKAPCVWWKYSVTQTKGSGRNKRKVTVATGTSEECFELRDDTGRCVVDPDGARVIPSRRHTWYGVSATPSMGPELGSGFLRAVFCDYTYYEELLLPGDRLYAVGAYRTQSAVGEPADEQLDLQDLLNKWKGDRRMMAMFDVNKDGTVDQREWEAARRMGLEKVRTERVRESVETPDLNILARPKDGRPYILSGVPQSTLVRRYRFGATACLALAAAGGWLLLKSLRDVGLVG